MEKILTNGGHGSIESRNDEEISMITKEQFDLYTRILKEELVPAMGCTEPISVAYAAALARKTLGVRPSAVTLTVSGNIIKNVKSVVVPNTGGLRGLEAAVAAGIVSGNADAELEVLSSVSDTQKAEIASYLAEAEIKVVPFGGSCVFEIEIRAEASGSSALVHLSGDHKNVVRIEKDGKVLKQKHYETGDEHEKPYRDLLSMPQKDAGTLTSVTLIFLAALLSGLGIFERIAKRAGGGTLVPITGFANSVVSPAIDSKSEGLILGVGAKIFTVAGPVLLYGTLAGAIFGVISFIFG